VAIVVLLASCAALPALPPAKSIKNFESIAGTWKGPCTYSGESKLRILHHEAGKFMGGTPFGLEIQFTIIVRPDGTYETVGEFIVPSRSGKPRTVIGKGRGKLELLKDGKVKAAKDGGTVETWTLHEGDGKRVISTSACLGQYTQVK